MRRLVAYTRLLHSIWRGVREWCGDAAYDRYLRAALRNQDAAPLSREAFYLEQLGRRYSRPSRCC
jgi:uncharacterized short protein YbdD (DUF466 family)